MDSSTSWKGTSAPRPAARGLRVRAAALGLGVALWTAPAVAQDDAASVRAAMSQIFGSIQVLLPLSVDDQAFRDPAHRAEIRRALDRLVQEAGDVAGHAGSGDRRIAFLASSLARESRETLRRYDDGQVEAAQFFVQRLTDFCVACHSRVPSPKDSAITRGFVTEGELAKLPPPQRATLLVATRRFDEAMTTLEGWITSPSVHPAELLEPITTYLTVAIRVKNDLARPIPTLEKVAARPDLWSYLRGDVEAWIATLRKFVGKTDRKPSLRQARELLEEARRQIRFPSDRRALVYYLLASSQLHRYLEVHPGESSRDVAEAYYWLGLIDSRVNGNYWVSESDFYLETAIRMAPGEEIARRAYALLEEETVLGWSGSGGVHIPQDVQAHLDELRALAEGT